MDWLPQLSRYSGRLRRTLNNLSRTIRTNGLSARVQWYSGLGLIVAAVACWSIPLAILLVGSLLVLNALYS